MKKNKQWSGFLTNLLGVILGILLTFGVNSLWQHYDEGKKTREMLILVRNELETNKTWFKHQQKEIVRDAYVYRKIVEANGKWSTIPADTLRAYRSTVSSISFSQLNTSAWQILQNSEIIQKMSDKELVIRLAECYYWIDKIHEIIMTEYWSKKKKTNPFELDPERYFSAVMRNKESRHFYETTNADDAGGFEDAFFVIHAYIDFVLSLLDKNGKFRYDMDRDNEHFQSFITARMDSVNRAKDTIQNHRKE